jgi:hypothetical protein
MGLVVLSCLGATLSACTASYPTTPSAPSAVALQLQVADALSEPMVHPATNGFKAFVVRSDGAWEDVTNRATWSTPDPGVLRASADGRFSTVGPGATVARVNYEGFAAFFDVVVLSQAQLSFPRLSATLPRRVGLGASGQAGVSLLVSSSVSRDVTAEAVWTSSMPSVATVERGLLTGRAVGTARISASVGDSTVSFLVSIAPPAS